MRNEAETVAERPRAAATFDRILVGIDASPESLEATRQAAVLAQGPLELLAAYDLAPALVGGMAPGVPAALDERPRVEAAEAALAEAQAEIVSAETTRKIARGPAWQALLDELERGRHTLVAVGSHGTGRAAGIVIGSTATELIHKAPCSVLVARTALGAFPSRIVVGLDGSEESFFAYETANELALRFEARLLPVFADLDDRADLEAARAVAGRHLRVIPNLPVEALVSMSAEVDLVVVGSRGLRGLKALGSVSERVAHRATSSVLIVRRPGSGAGE